MALLARVWHWCKTLLFAAVLPFVVLLTHKPYKKKHKATEIRCIMPNGQEIRLKVTNSEFDNGLYRLYATNLGLQKAPRMVGMLQTDFIDAFLGDTPPDSGRHDF